MLDGARTYVFRSGCTFGVESTEECSEESLDFERSELEREVEKCLDEGTREGVTGVCELLGVVGNWFCWVADVAGEAANREEAEWLEK